MASRSETTRSPSIADQRRMQIVEATFAVIAEHGLEGLRTREIGALAGVNTATIHYYFGSKDAVIAAVVESLEQRFTRPVPRAAGAEQGLRFHVRQAIASLSADPRLPVVLSELSLRARRDPLVGEELTRLQRHWLEEMRRTIEADIAAGAMRPGTDAESVAFALVSAIMGLSSQLVVAPQEPLYHGALGHLLDPLYV